jgi:hypothetical protein
VTRGGATVVDSLGDALERRPEVLEAYLFGSLARGEAQPHSDVDVAVYLAPGAGDPSGLGLDAAIAADLMRALETSRVDVVVLNAAPPLLYHRVLRDGVRLFARDLRATTVREGRALSRYCDYVPQLAKIRAAREGRLERGEFGR